jgi:hypothetical protein
MQTYCPTLPLQTRLQILRAAVPRKPIVRRMVLPADIELHGWVFAILRANWTRHFGVTP